MRENRKSPRAGLNLKLEAHKIYNKDVDCEVNQAEIILKNISKGGIAFSSNQDFPVGFYFNTRIDINKDTGFYAVLRIVRKSESEGAKNYGCEFIGLADIVSKTLDELFYD